MVSIAANHWLPVTRCRTFSMLKKSLAKLLRLALTAILCLPLAACGGWQSALNAHGPEAERLAKLFWFFTAVCGVVWLLVILALGWALFRRTPRTSAPDDPVLIDPDNERRSAVAVWALTAASVVVLVVFTLVSFFASRGLNAASADTLNIEVTGYQWWWQIRYLDPNPSSTFTTANEIHVPVGRPVKVSLVAGDVIHSFWVPNLAGKLDLIPGQTNELTFAANRPGVYRGQCAEFCGLQHAFMGLRVIAEPEQDFAAWRARQIQPARQSDDDLVRSGERVFLNNGCILCHTIRGTTAGGRAGPDLTHIGSRSAIAADTLPNTLGYMAGWIADPQSIKPGNYMPSVPLDGGDLNALVHYLEALK
jgi:cytochrome c oxidase subunit 2